MTGWGNRIATVVLFAALAWTRQGLESTFHREVHPVNLGDTMSLMAADDGDGGPQRLRDAVGSEAQAVCHQIPEPGHDHPSSLIEASGTTSLQTALGQVALRPVSGALEPRVLQSSPGQVLGPGSDHHHGHHHAHGDGKGQEPGDAHGHHHQHQEGEEQPEGVSNGMVLLLKHLGLQELAANLLWVQMDADSHRGLWHRVEFALELIPTIDPHFVEAYLLHAYLLDQFQGKHQRSIEILQTGLRNNPWRSELWIQLGVQFFNVNRHHGPDRDLEKALAAFSQACRLSDCPGYIFRFRAIVLACLDRREEAIAWLEQVRDFPGRFGGDRRQDEHLLQRLRAGETWE